MSGAIDNCFSIVFVNAAQLGLLHLHTVSGNIVVGPI